MTTVFLISELVVQLEKRSVHGVRNVAAGIENDYESLCLFSQCFKNFKA